MHYSGSKEKQCIQFNYENKSLFSFDDIKYLSENRNLDICVADYEAHAVVVVNRAGLHTLAPVLSSRGHLIRTALLQTAGMILTADSSKHFIHILDQDEQFLRYIDNCDIHYPWGICIDKQDNLFVAKNRTGKVKIIKYYS